jgi:hypothetical protein
MRALLGNAYRWEASIVFVPAQEINQEYGHL